MKGQHFIVLRKLVIATDVGPIVFWVSDFFYAPNFEEVEAYWFWPVRATVGHTLHTVKNGYQVREVSIFTSVSKNSNSY